MSDETGPSIGTQLRARRIELGRPLAEFAAKTRIRQIYLEALEEDRYEDFPGEAYLTGFLKGYASALGLDPDEIVARYREQFGGKPGELSERILPAATVVVPAHAPSRGRRRILILLLVVLVIVLAALGFLYYLGTTSVKAPPLAAAAEGQAAPPAAPSASEVQTAPTSPAAKPGYSPAASPSVKSEPALSSASSADSSKSVRPVAGNAEPVAHASLPTVANAQLVPPGGITLHIEASGATNVILAIDGRSPQKYDLLPGSTLSWRIDARAHLHVDHADRVMVRLGQKPVALAGRTDIDFRSAAEAKATSEKGH